MSSIRKSRRGSEPKLYPKYILDKQAKRKALGIIPSASTLKVEDMLAETFYRISARCELNKKEKDPNYKTVEECWEIECWYMLL